jgi:hypothetical protein
MNQKYDYDVAISYKGSDKNFADELTYEFMSYGLRVFLTQ